MIAGRYAVPLLKLDRVVADAAAAATAAEVDESSLAARVKRALETAGGFTPELLTEVLVDRLKVPKSNCLLSL